MEFISEEALERRIKANADAADLFGSEPKKYVPLPKLKEVVKVQEIEEPKLSREEVLEIAKAVCPAPESECLVCIYGSMPMFLLNNYFCQFPGVTSAEDRTSLPENELTGMPVPLTHSTMESNE